MGIFEFIYYLGCSAKKHYSLKHQKRLPHRVISIGNITAGGTGKTPAAIAIADEAKKRGFYPVILTRGYKGKAKGPCFVQDAGSQIQDARYGIRDEKHHASCIMHHASYDLFGDEPLLMSEILKDVPIVKCADRYEGGMFALQNLKSTHSPIHPFTISKGAALLRCCSSGFCLAYACSLSGNSASGCVSLSLFFHYISAVQSLNHAADRFCALASVADIVFHISFYRTLYIRLSCGDNN